MTANNKNSNSVANSPFSANGIISNVIIIAIISIIIFDKNMP